MGTKDVTENYLEAYNDVFADIVNVLLFNGEEKISPDQLTNMCEVMERAVNKGRKDIIKQLLSSGMSAEQIASAVKIPLAEIKKIEAEMLQTV